MDTARSDTGKARLRKTPREVWELCVNCMIDLEDHGWVAERVSTGLVKCRKCGRECWGAACRMSREEPEE